MEGYILLHKSLLDWEWYDDANVMRLFVHSMLKVNYRDKVWRGKLLKRGQFISTPGRLASELNLTVKQIRTAIKKLESTGEMASEGTSQHTVFTINNFDKWQPKGERKASEGQAKGEAKDEQGASEGQAEGKQEYQESASQEASESIPEAPDNKGCGENGGKEKGEQKEEKGQAAKQPKRKKRATANKRNKELNNIDITFIPSDLTLSDHWRSLAENYWQSKGVGHIDVETQFLRFVSHHKSKATTSANWQSNWTTWYCNAVDFSRPQGGSNAAHQYGNQRDITSGNQQGSSNDGGLGGTGEVYFTDEDMQEIEELYSGQGQSPGTGDFDD